MNERYESGRNLSENRSDTVGQLRTGYRAVSGMLGKGNCEADVAYGMVDLSSSVYGIGKIVLKPDSWRLFRYVCINTREDMKPQAKQHYHLKFFPVQQQQVLYIWRRK